MAAATAAAAAAAMERPPFYITNSFLNHKNTGTFAYIYATTI